MPKLRGKNTKKFEKRAFFIRYAKVEKIPGGVMEDCEVLNGVMFNKDVTHP